MLHRVRFVDALQSASKKIFFDTNDQMLRVIDAWKVLANDQDFIQKSVYCNGTLPTWQGLCNDVHEIDKILRPYGVIGVDGSQIYPDKHQGVGCFLINIGSVVLSYGKVGSNVFFDSYPYFFVDAGQEQNCSLVDLVNAKRDVFELEYGYKKMLEYQKNEYQEPVICMMDGTFIFRHMSQEEHFRNYFLTRSIAQLDLYSQKNMMLMGYLSYPRSKELIALVSLYMQKKGQVLSDEQLFDAMMLEYILKPGQRTTVFYHRSSIVSLYPEHLAPCFVYCHVGSEIVRIEFPRYEATQEYVDLLCFVAYDQAQKGVGYPVSLAEAHEQAVVTHDDRDFFYHMIKQVSIQARKQLRVSPKLQKKKVLVV